MGASRSRSVAWLLVAGLLACAPAPAEGPRAVARGEGAAPSDPAQASNWKLVKTYKHQKGAYTQGLVWWNGHLYESTGKWGASSVRRVELETGKVLKNTPLPREYFGEGLALWGDRFIQLTWKAGKARIYDRDTLEFLDDHEYKGEGWGLTSVGEFVVMSDGSNVLRFLDPNTFVEVKKLEVTENGRGLHKLNELEEIEGDLFANVYQTNRIVRIDLETGKVLESYDLSALLGDWYPDDGASVLNGIAYDKKAKRVFVTGKFWPFLFEIRLLSKNVEQGPADD